ncbi:hypothetical protein TanjilG_12146 [Lupinus angustifolius]|uniref:Protein SCAR n=1 Tax=Lupinus angustifolius TaxID=3871 RepID=A0A1J7H887_LUPAN|nr:PREDICTED: protein SCAR2-like isoform X2 [Lupinus angustifolius]OIV98560.1 hypothetical protein TanjilG_12146 [Lupinus angustifolius]
MPISRYQIRSEYGLADPELYRGTEYDVPETLLEGVSMAALVGFLRQLGDLAQFAAEIFHDLHEEVLATMERGHSLVNRVQQLEAEVPVIEKAFLSQTHHSPFFTNGGIDWHPNLHYEQNLVTQGDLPRFIRDSYEECCSPPRLFLLDKFDVAGAGACLKRYTDPSFFKVDPVPSETATVEVHREERIRKVKKKGARPRNRETPEAVQAHAKLHQLFLEEPIGNAHSDPACLVKLRKKELSGSAVDEKTGRSYMEKILETPSPDHKMVRLTPTTPLPTKLISKDASETGIKILEISCISPVKRSLRNESLSLQSRPRPGLWCTTSPNEQEFELEPYSGMDEAEIAFDEQKKMECSLDGYRSDDVTSEVDYMDALATIESDLEADNDGISKKYEEYQLQAQLSDSQSFGSSSTADEVRSPKQDINGEHTEVLARFSDSKSTGASCTSDNVSSLRRDSDDKHAQLHIQFPDFQSTVNSFALEVEEMIPNQLPQTVELRNTHCGEFVTCDDAHVQGEEISDSRQVFSGSCVMGSGHLLLPSDLGPTSPPMVPLPTETESDETPSGHVEHCLRLEAEEDKECLVESLVSVPDALSLIKDGACPVVSTDDSSFNNMDVFPYAHSYALLQVSNDLNSAHKDDCGYHSEIKMLQEECPNEYSSDISVAGDVSLQREGPSCLSMEGELNSGTKLLLNGEDLTSDDGILLTQLNSDDLCSVVETPPVSSFTEDLCHDLTLRSSLDEPDSAENEFLNSDPHSNSEGVPTMIHGKSGSTCIVDGVDDDGHIEHPSSPDYTSQDNHDVVNDTFTKNVQSEGLIVTALPSVDSAETGTSPSWNLSNLNEPFPGSFHQMEVESNEVDLNAEKRGKLKPSLDIICSPTSYLTELEESLSTIADSREKEMDVDETVARESLTELVGQKLVDQSEISSADVQPNSNTSVSCDTSDSEICSNIQESQSIFSFQNDLQNCNDNLSSPSYYQLEPETHLELFSQSHLGQQNAGFLLGDEVNYTLEKFQPQQMQISNQLEQERLSHTASEFAPTIHPDEPSSCDSSSKSPGLESNPTKLVMDPLKPLIPELFPKAAKINFQEAPPMPPLPPMQWRMRKAQHASPVSQREEIEVNQAMFPPMKTVKPDDKSQFGSSTSKRETLQYQNPSSPVMNVESNKHQHSPRFSMGISEHPVAIPLQFPTTVNEANGQSNYLVLERSQIQNHFLSLPVISTGWPAHGYILSSEREMVQNSNPFPPIPPSDRAISGDDPVSVQEKPTQFPSQPMEETSLEVKKDRLGEHAECTVLGVDPISPQEKLVQSPSQSTEETSLEVIKATPGELHLVLPAECAACGDCPISPNQPPTQSPSQMMEVTSTLEPSSINLEGEREDPKTSPVSPPSIEIAQTNHSLPPSAGQMALSLETPAETPEFDSEMANGKPKNKLPPPQSPLIEAFDKSRLRKVTDRVRPQLAPKEDERDSLLQQIRTKSFNLKPAVATPTRPSIQGPRTNLRVAAMLEKANAIRQALAGSDEDDDADSWSDC